MFFQNTFVLGALLLLSACNNPPFDAKAMQKIAESQPDFKTVTSSYEGHTLAGVTTGKSCNPALFYIHGAPGSWQAWGAYLGDKDLAAQAYQIAADRPGYSGSANTGADENLPHQAASLAALLQSAAPQQKAIVVGHSFGGPLALQLALDNPDRIAGIIILAGSIDPALEDPRWYNRVASWWPIRDLIPTLFDTANREILAARPYLYEQTPRLAELKIPVTVIQGETDELVSPANADYAAQHIPHATIIRIAAQGHFLPWQQFDVVKNSIVAMLGAPTCR